MPRQWYETQANVDAETAVGNKIAELTLLHSQFLIDNGIGFMANVVMQKLPPLTYKVDWCMSKGKEIKAWAELKIRNMEVNKYPDVMISAHKMVCGRELSLHSGVPFVIFIAFSDRLGFHIVDLDRSYRMEYGGRTKATRDSADIEPVCFMNVSEFFLF